jgi:hypothetical protein
MNTASVNWLKSVFMDSGFRRNDDIYRVSAAIGETSGA